MKLNCLDYNPPSKGVNKPGTDFPKNPKLFLEKSIIYCIFGKVNGKYFNYLKQQAPHSVHRSQIPKPFFKLQKY